MTQIPWDMFAKEIDGLKPENTGWVEHPASHHVLHTACLLALLICTTRFLCV